MDTSAFLHMILKRGEIVDVDSEASRGTRNRITPDKGRAREQRLSIGDTCQHLKRCTKGI